MSRRVTRSSNVRRISRFLTVFVAAVAVVVSTVAPATLATASASTGSSTSLTRVAADPAQAGIIKTSLAGFNPGNIMSDAVFTNKSTMSEAQIQSFLNGKVAKCRSGYVCLKDLKTTSQSKAKDSYCAAYAGASGETAARIIYKVSQACNMNPQVLITMLQKEQGLVTHTWPSDWRFNKAMGQGCPDTAPCNIAYAGFFAQVYGAARQMQVYMEGKYFTWYKAGKTWNILYHPNRNCGTSPVYIANKATEALYYYTPYQPNAAALRAGYGTGDGCSSYGNRNLYNYFTDWFGPTKIAVTGAIAKEWARLGGANGTLGQPQMNAAHVSINGGGYYQRFTGGSIWWKSGASTAYGMGNGAFLTNYKAAGAERGSWGWPASQATCALVQGGCKMTFQKGTTYYSPTTQSVLVPQAMVAAYTKAGAERSGLGYPAKPATIGAAGKMEQQFAAATGAYSPATGLIQLTPGLADAWRSAGGVNSSLGMPKSAPTALSGNGAGKVLELNAGTVWESPAGAFVMGYGAFRTNYIKAGGPEGAWGWPAGVAKCGLTGGGCYMNFQKGTVGYSSATGSVLMAAAVFKEWLRVDPKSIGYPKATAAGVNGGSVQEFTAGTIYSSTAGSFAMGFGPLRTDYLKAGGPTGTWGWPTDGATCGLTGRGCYMPFQSGVIGYSSGTGSVLMTPAVLKEWLRVDPKSIGYPKAAAAALSGGSAQEFTAGTIYSSKAGSFAMGFGPLRTDFLKAGGPTGAWGWPTAGATCGLIDRGCYMPFQKGLVTYLASTGSVFVPSGAILNEWNRLGGVNSKLGYPTKAATVSGTVTMQRFQKGIISYDSATKKVTVG